MNLVLEIILFNTGEKKVHGNPSLNLSIFRVWWNLTLCDFQHALCKCNSFRLCAVQVLIFFQGVLYGLETLSIWGKPTLPFAEAVPFLLKSYHWQKFGNRDVTTRVTVHCNTFLFPSTRGEDKRKVPNVNFMSAIATTFFFLWHERALLSERGKRPTDWHTMQAYNGVKCL